LTFSVRALELSIQQDRAYYKQARKIANVPSLAAYLMSCTECKDAKSIRSDWKKQQIEQLPEVALLRLAQFDGSSLSTKPKNNWAQDLYYNWLKRMANRSNRKTWQN